MNLLIRVDASTKIGTGHIMRCLALAQAWEDAGGVAHFVTVDLPEGLEMRLAAECMTLHTLDVIPGSHEDSEQCAALAKKLDAAWVVVDGYHFGADYQHNIKKASMRLLVIDDYGHAGHYAADLVLNQNIYAEADLYESRELYTQFLFGTTYAMLRREFWSWRDWKRTIPEKAKNILVTMGGSDPDNVTLKVIQALKLLKDDDLQVVIIAGGSNPYYSLLKAAIEDSGESIQLRQNVTDMPPLLAWADLAISAAGSTCWELAFMGVPSLLLVLAENQENVADYLNKEKAAICLGSGKQADSSIIATKTMSLANNIHLRKAISSRVEKLVDGFGTKRVITSMGMSQ